MILSPNHLLAFTPATKLCVWVRGILAFFHDMMKAMDPMERFG